MLGATAPPPAPSATTSTSTTLPSGFVSSASRKAHTARATKTCSFSSRESVWAWAISRGTRKRTVQVESSTVGTGSSSVGRRTFATYPFRRSDRARLIARLPARAVSSSSSNIAGDHSTSSRLAACRTSGGALARPAWYC